MRLRLWRPFARARAEGAGRARRTLGRLRAAQIGEYLAFVLFQLREYMITIVSITESIALSIPKDDAKLAERVDRLKRSVGELHRKVSRLLGDKSALTAAAARASESVDVLALVREIAEEARAAFAPPGAEISVFAREVLPPARVDRRPVELALLSVLQNAFEACGERSGPCVAVRVRRAGGAAEIEVADAGGGISETVKPIVFEPIACARPESSRIGLGLSMSRRFLERLGGSLELRTGEGRTNVVLTIPFEPVLPNIRNEESTWAGRRAGT